MAGSVELFISHKHEDKDIALKIREELELASPRLNCFVSEHIPYGSDWFETIRTNLDGADILLLIFTSSTNQWDWPLYEVGLATSLDEPDRCRIVCIYPPGAEPPDPIKAFQAVEATEEGLEKFLRQLFCTKDLVEVEPVLNERLKEGEGLQRLARELAECFTTVEPWENCFTYYLWIVVEDVANDEHVENEEVPASAFVDPESTALELFGLASKPPGREHWLWQDLLSKVGDSDDSRWVSELGERFKWASRGSILKSMTSTFESPSDESAYRPLLHKVSLRRDGAMRFEVIFVEQKAA